MRVAPSPKSRRSPSIVRAFFRALLLVVSGVIICLVFISSKIASEAESHDLHPADAIVVFGAAQYDGRPSPVFRARLDHAFNLYKRNLAPVVITTGGPAADPSFTEGGVGHDYLVGRGIPDAGVIAETQGSDSSQSAQRLAVIMRANHMHGCIAVSDAYHLFRIRRLLEHEGLVVSVSARPDSRPRTVLQRAMALMRESASYMLWRGGVVR